MDDYLSSVYYHSNRSGGFGGVNRLYDDVKQGGKFKISRAKTKEWLMKQGTYTLYKPVRRNFKRNHVIVGVIDQQWQLDLDAVHAKVQRWLSLLPRLHRCLIKVCMDRAIEK